MRLTIHPIFVRSILASPAIQSGPFWSLGQPFMGRGGTNLLFLTVFLTIRILDDLSHTGRSAPARKRKLFTANHLAILARKFPVQGGWA